MKSLVQPECVSEIRQRIRRLSVKNPRQWGKMTVNEMVCHLADAYQAHTQRPRMRGGKSGVETRGDEECCTVWSLAVAEGADRHGAGICLVPVAHVPRLAYRGKLGAATSTGEGPRAFGCVRWVRMKDTIANRREEALQFNKFPPGEVELVAEPGRLGRIVIEETDPRSRE